MTAMEHRTDPLRNLMIARPPLTLAVAESLTSGHLQAAIGARSGASDFFLGGITAYSIDQKVTHLGVDRDEAERHRRRLGESGGSDGPGCLPPVWKFYRSGHDRLCRSLSRVRDPLAAGVSGRWPVQGIADRS